MRTEPLPDKLHFVLPDDREKPSGGNIYNRYLVEALEKLGQPVEICSLTRYREALEKGQPGIFGVDSLFVDALRGEQLKSAGIFSFFILHHLQSLHPPKGASGDALFEREERQVLEQFDLILATSDFSRDYLRQKQLKLPVVVVEPALPDLPFEPPLSADAPLRGLMVANVVERKGILPFLQALLANGRVDDNFDLTIIGRQDMEPAYYQTCQTMVKNSFLSEKVRFQGALSHKETMLQYHRHHLLVSAASMETYGMALQEARSLGMPILVLQGGYSARHIRQGNGILCEDIFELTRNFLQLSRSKAALRACLDTARIHYQEATYRWEEAAAIFLRQIRNFL
jgi:glycosyltransferase involved in cell wall biosynthesis